MVKSCSPPSSPSFHKLRNNNDKQQSSFEHEKVYKCEFCPKVFTSGKALGGHQNCHRSKKLQIHDHHHVNKAHKTMNTTSSLSSSPSYHNNHHTEKKRHSWTRVLKGTVHHPPSALEPCQQELPDADLLSLLPPRSYNTKKRSRRYLIHHGLANNTAPIPLLDVSRESAENLDLNHRECKRVKLSGNRKDTEKMEKKPFVPQTSDGIDETVVKEEKNLKEGETTVSRVVRNIDLNEVSTNDVETELGPRVVRNIDLNELPANDVESE